MSNEIKDKLIDLLIEMFQFENEDLDFGIYKILNYKRDEISKFIEKDLKKEINAQLELLYTEDRKKKFKNLEELKNKFQELELDYKNQEKYINAKKELKKIKPPEELELGIYNHIYTFFSRYYDKGDFISKRRYGETQKYLVPYNGEETFFYWANNDQYYIKTSDSLIKYRFKVDDLYVNFRIMEDIEENNSNEKNNKFLVHLDRLYDLDDELTVYFEYRPLTIEEKRKCPKNVKQTKLNEINFKIIKKALINEKSVNGILNNSENSKIFLNNINKYTKKNTYDYFIHKDLYSFLGKELDFYIKNEVMDLNDASKLDLDQFNRYSLEIKILKNICGTIIEFLAQIENYQLKLWEKKKFVLKTDYIISIYRIPEEFHNEILENSDQLKEWNEIFSLNTDSKTDLINFDSINGEILKNLPVDTNHFPESFKERLIEKLTEKNDLEELIDGILINSENYQALNLLLDKYREKIKCIYIDPPYNTGSDLFLYKDNYKHSSWLSMMQSRLELAKEYLMDNGVIFVSIDFHELTNLHSLMDQIFDSDKKLGLFHVKVRHDDRILTGDKEIQETIEQALAYKADKFTVNKIDIDENLELYKYKIIEKNENPKHIMLGDKDAFLFKEGEYEVIKEDNCLIPDEYLKEISVRGTIRKSNSSGRLFVDFIENNYNPETLIKVENMGADGLGYRYFRMPRNSKNGVYYQGRPVKKTINTKPYPSFFDYVKEFNNVGYEGGIDFKNGKKPIDFLIKLFEIANLNDNSVVLDFFGGSGSTAHAILKFNQMNNTKIKFILIEMAEYFDDVLIPRLKNTMYSINWKNKKALDEDGTGGFFKYHYIEQYEDSLENIEFCQKTIMDFKDYFVKYMIDFETKSSKTFLNIDKMQDPFNYQIKTLKNNYKSVSIDLIESYNYLLGLKIQNYKFYNDKDQKGKKYAVVTGKSGNNNVIIIWRDITSLDLEKDKKFIEKIVNGKHYEIHINGNSIVKDAILIEKQFKRLMNGS